MANKLIWKHKFGTSDAADGVSKLGFLFIPEANADNQVAVGDAQWPKIGMRLGNNLGLKPRNYTPVAPAPVLDSINPTTGVAATPYLLTCTGSNFTSGSKIRIDNVEQATTFVSATSLTCNYTGTEGVKSVLVRNADGQNSAPQSLTITATE